MRILIADDHGIVRQGLRSLLEAEPDWEVIGEAPDGRTAVEMAKQLYPDLIIMDITMPDLNGVDATRQILRHDAKAKIVILSVHAEPDIVRSTLTAGAMGYVLKTHLFEDLANAIRSAVAGHHYLSPAIAGVVIDDYFHGGTGEHSGVSGELNGREREVVQLIAEGKTAKQAAMVLHISPKTVDACRRQAMTKLGISSVAELTKYAIREGMTSANI